MMALTSPLIIYKGYGPPFFGGHQNVLSQQSGDRLIKNDLLQLLMTSPGERVMRPTWGTILKQSVFEPMTARLMAAIQTNIAQQIAAYEPRVQVNVTVTVDPINRNQLNVALVGTYTGQPNSTFIQEISLPLSSQ